MTMTMMMLMMHDDDYATDEEDENDDISVDRSHGMSISISCVLPFVWSSP